MSKATKPVVIVTGVSSGIGQATATLFVSRGWIVVGTVRGRARGAALRGMQMDLQVADMLKPRDLERVVQTAWRTYGRLDAVVCNAGYGLIGPIDSLTYAQLTEVMTVNSLAPAELARQAVPLMRRQGFGTIVGISSIVGRTGFTGYSGYAASKFALEGLFESLAIELAASPVRLKLVEPSGVNTPFWTALQRGNSRAWGSKELGAGAVNPGHRGLSAEGVAAVIFRAATDRSYKLRFPVGLTGLAMVVRRLLPERVYFRLLRWVAQRH